MESDCACRERPVPAASRGIPLGVLEKAATAIARAAVTVLNSGGSSGRRKAEFPHG